VICFLPGEEVVSPRQFCQVLQALYDTLCTEPGMRAARDLN